jgi:hypothetical protein
MTRYPVRGSTSLALVLALTVTQTGWTQTSSSFATSVPMSAPSTASADRSYRIYSLDEMGGDPGFGEWIAQTIPEVIATGTWKGPGVIRYYAPKNILVVCHTAAVQTKVGEFLSDVKKSLPDGKKGHAAAVKRSAPSAEVVPAAYRAPASLKTPSSTVEPTLSYPVPAQAKSPKHLFHFIIRYEGDGIIDDSVVKVMKAYIQAEKKGAETPAVAAVPVVGYSASQSGTRLPSSVPAPVVPSRPEASPASPYPAPVAPAVAPSVKEAKKPEAKDNEKKEVQPEEP